MPAAKPANLKLLSGRSPGRDSGGRKVIQSGIERGVPDKPDDMSVEASAEWDRLVDGSGIRSWLKPADRAALVNLCETWSEVVRLRKYLRRNGFKQRVTVRDSAGAESIKYVERPEVKMYRATLVEHRYLSTAFGVTPVAETAAARATATDTPAADASNPFAGTS